MQLHPDFSAFIGCLIAREVRFLVVGGYAVAAHGHPRYTGDLDIWVMVHPENATGVVAALDDFGFGDLGITTSDFAMPQRVVQLGFPPVRIDLLTSIEGVDFEACHPRRIEVDLAGMSVPFIGHADLLRNKEAAGRPQDAADAAALRSTQ